MLYNDELYAINIDTAGIKQGEECFDVFIKEDNENVKIHIWDYNKLYKYPYLFEVIYQKILKSNSIYFVWDNFLKYKDIRDDELRILDVAAGSGLAGEYMRRISNPKSIHGLDILESARTACMRDYQKIYDDYYVLNLRSIKCSEKTLLKDKNFNCISIISASGGSDDDFDYHDVELQEYETILELISRSGYIILNVRERELKGQTEIKKLLGKHCYLINEAAYTHRQLLNGSAIAHKALVYKML